MERENYVQALMDSVPRLSEEESCVETSRHLNDLTEEQLKSREVYFQSFSQPERRENYRYQHRNRYSLPPPLPHITDLKQHLANERERALDEVKRRLKEREEPNWRYRPDSTESQPSQASTRYGQNHPNSRTNIFPEFGQGASTSNAQSSGPNPRNSFFPNFGNRSGPNREQGGQNQTGYKQESWRRSDTSVLADPSYEEDFRPSYGSRYALPGQGNTWRRPPEQDRSANAGTSGRRDRWVGARGTNKQECDQGLRQSWKVEVETASDEARRKTELSDDSERNRSRKIPKSVQEVNEEIGEQPGKRKSRKEKHSGHIKAEPSNMSSNANENPKKTSKNEFKMEIETALKVNFEPSEGASYKTELVDESKRKRKSSKKIPKNPQHMDEQIGEPSGKKKSSKKEKRIDTVKEESSIEHSNTNETRRKSSKKNERVHSHITLTDESSQEETEPSSAESIPAESEDNFVKRRVVPSVSSKVVTKLKAANRNRPAKYAARKRKGEAVLRAASGATEETETRFIL